MKPYMNAVDAICISGIVTIMTIAIIASMTGIPKETVANMITGTVLVFLLLILGYWMLEDDDDS